MILTDLEERIPKLKDYTKNMPDYIRKRCIIKTHKAGSIIHQKNTELINFGIVASGENRVINELENGNVYMIESNKAIDFIGEVTILANMKNTSVTIEALTDNIVIYMSRKDAEHWFSIDMNILRLVAHHSAFKLYRSSYNNGAKLFYPPAYLLIDYIVKYAYQNGIESYKFLPVTIYKTRQMLQEEIGVSVKTLNRTISQLKDADFFSIIKGKITLTKDQYYKAIKWLEVESLK